MVEKSRHTDAVGANLSALLVGGKPKGMIYGRKKHNNFLLYITVLY
jgi:hypothetical protein